LKDNSQRLVLGAAGNQLAQVDDEEPALTEEDTGEDCRVVVQGIVEGKAGTQADGVQASGLAENMARGGVGCLGPGKFGDNAQDKTGHTQEDSSRF